VGHREEGETLDQAANLRKLVIQNDTARKTKTIAITSGKGGVGKSSLAVSIAIALSRKGFSVTLLDADLGLANINVILGIIPKFTILNRSSGVSLLRASRSSIPMII